MPEFRLVANDLRKLDAMASKKPRKTAPHNEPTADERSAGELLEATRQMLGNAQLGLRDIQSSDPARRIPGLHNVAVYGRAVTIALQRLRSVVDGFDDWYKTQIPDKDPLLIYFNNVRNEILKEAKSPRQATVMHVESFSGRPIEMLHGPRPEGATGFFIGEGGTGGSGWHVTLPDGTQTKYYSALSSKFSGSVATHLPDAPSEFLGESFDDSTVISVAGRYVTWLEELIADAERWLALK
jgi:hypothetical protein